MARKTLTDKGITALKPRATRYAHPDPELRGHYVRVQPNGARSFVTVARSPAGKQVWTTIGAADTHSIDEARTMARDVIKRVRNGLTAFEAPKTKPHSFRNVSEVWLKRYVKSKGLRSEKEIRRFLTQHVLPEWGDRPFISIRRSDVAALLDGVEDGHGARQADHVLAIVRGICNWHATRSDDYTPPIVKGMGRTNPKERARKRTLDDDEMRAIWRVAEGNGTFGAMIRLLLLTAQRRAKVASMRWDDISQGVWTIPTAPREKGNPGAMALPEPALAIITAMPRIGTNPFVFSGRGNSHFSGFSKCKAAFDKKLPAIPNWQLHDLRRTARSLMARAGVPREIAERVLGHAIEGVEGVYDRYNYAAEKAEALQRLAGLIRNIIDPQPKVLKLRGRRQ